MGTATDDLRSSEASKDGIISMFCRACCRAMPHKHFVFKGDRYICQGCGDTRRLDEEPGELRLEELSEPFASELSASEPSSVWDAAKAQGVWPDEPDDDEPDDEEDEEEARTTEVRP